MLRRRRDVLAHDIAWSREKAVRRVQLHVAAARVVDRMFVDSAIGLPLAWQNE